jgi:O-methyltransferase involved in polyketide biosynthesis
VVRKRRALGQLPGRSPRHHVITLDALIEDGATSIFDAPSALLEPDRGVAIITEGLLGYFPRDQVVAMWGRFARVLSRYGGGIYLADLHLDDEMHDNPTVRALRTLIGTVARGNVHTSFKNDDDLQQALGQVGFSSATLHRPSEYGERLTLPLAEGPDLVKVVEARPA